MPKSKQVEEIFLHEEFEGFNFIVIFKNSCAESLEINREALVDRVKESLKKALESGLVEKIAGEKTGNLGDFGGLPCAQIIIFIDCENHYPKIAQMFPWDGQSLFNTQNHSHKVEIEL